MFSELTAFLAHQTKIWDAMHVVLSLRKPGYLVSISTRTVNQVPGNGKVSRWDLAQPPKQVDQIEMAFAMCYVSRVQTAILLEL